MIRTLAILLLLGTALSTGGCAKRSSSGDRASAGSPGSTGSASALLPNPYRPDRANDSHAHQQWEDGVRRLEAHCQRDGQMCAEAKAARASLGRM